MKFNCAVDIDLPRVRVVELFDKPENMEFWQDGFLSFEPKSDNYGAVGSQSLIKYDIKGRKMDLLETITARDLPHKFYATYEGDFGKNSMNNDFIQLGPQQTRWTAEIEYTEMNGFIMNMMAKLMPGMFRKQTQKWMDQFKAWSEALR